MAADQMYRRPPWLLALAFITAVVAVVVLITSDHEEDVWQVLELATPVLAALFVLDRVDARSDAQDEKLESNHAAVKDVREQVNGALTQRMADAEQPILDAVAQIRADQVANQNTKADTP